MEYENLVLETRGVKIKKIDGRGEEFLFISNLTHSGQYSV